ncbi:MAG: hypothetical protein V4672_01720 [Verrucomicrobiota bacterium]
MPPLEMITGYLEKALKSKQTGSALSPLLWINALVTVPCLLVSAFLAAPMNFVFFGLGAFIVLFSLWEYRTLVRIDPRLVQSEKLQFELAKLDIVASKGGKSNY